MGGLSPAERLDALARAVEAGAGVLPADVVARAEAVEERAGRRMRLSAEHTVAAFAGATGSGKSSLFNAVVGEPLAAVDVLRPTTSEALAAVRGAEGAAPLLEWLAVRRRHVLDDDEQAPLSPDDGGLVLLDLPDHDSVVVEHRLEAERLVALVDLMVWVVDPQKYADGALHERYLRPLASHRDVVVVVLNQVDRLSAAEREACRRDLERLLALDGLPGVRVLEASARTGEGVAELRAALDGAARRREAAVARVLADVGSAATRVLEHCGAASSRPASARDRLVDALGTAAGVPLVVDAVREGWAARGRAATGWPPTRWIGRFRPDPLRRLHLRGPGDDHGDPEAEVARTSLPPAGPAERARARAAVLAYADDAATGAPDPWVLAARDAVDPDALPDLLDHAVGSAPLVPARRPAWWSGVGALQWVLVAVMVAGAGWLGVLAALGALQLFVPDPPRWGDVPWPTVLLVGGAALGVLVAVVARLLVGAGARRRAARARTRLRRAVESVADEAVVAPVGAVLTRMDACRTAATVAAEGAGRRRRGAGRGGS
ncbi:GTPase [Actinotalea sp. AC32]|nr:GTPase [Actinotalea sp. AC32]